VIGGNIYREQRLASVRRTMVDRDVDAILLSLGADLPWLTGYEAMPLERLTMAVVTVVGEAMLVVPELEAPRVGDLPPGFSLRPWGETEDPIMIVASSLREVSATRLAISDRCWARFVLALQEELVGMQWTPSSRITGPIRACKDEQEIETLSLAAGAADRVASQLIEGEIPLIGRTESEVSADISRRLIDEGHERVNFAIVASGPNAASPHHEASTRLIQAGDPVVCDFGGSLVSPADKRLGMSGGYCSDITRTVCAGEPDGRFREVYEVVRLAQSEALAAAKLGVACEEVDLAARNVISEAGYGEYFIHRTGHGIGMEEHEDPYLVAGNASPLVEGNAFSIEPGIYIPGEFGVRIEDIVISTRSGPVALNCADHALSRVR